MKFTLKQLEAFIWVCDLGSFRKAADRLNTTQPNISSRIASLESALDASLMERDAGSVRLTPKGEKVLEQAREVFNKTDALVASIGNNSLYDETLRLGVTELIVHTWLREFLRKLKEQYPNVTVELTVDLSVNLKTSLHNNALDLVFQNGPFERQMSGSVDLGSYGWIWVASSGLSIETHKNFQYSDFLKYPILTHARDTKPYHDVDRHFTNDSGAKPKLVPSSNLATCLYMVQEGMGLAALPKVMVQNDLSEGALIELDYKWVPDPLDFMARYDASRTSNVVELSAKLAGEISKSYSKR